jgi:transposase
MPVLPGRRLPQHPDLPLPLGYEPGRVGGLRAAAAVAGKLVTWARTRLKPKLTLEIVKRPDDLHTFKVLPRRWVVERTLSWITRHRRTVRDYERQAAHHETYILLRG